MKHLIIAILTAGSMAACGGAEERGDQSNTQTEARSQAPAATANGTTATDDTVATDTAEAPANPTVGTTTDETVTAEVNELQSDLEYLRQEEKLARDVYLTLGETYSAQVFVNIPNSEQTHMDRVLDLLDARGIADPVAGMDVGEFRDAFFNELFVDLVSQGLESREAAFGVGVAIEELDIKDLDERIAKNPPADVAAVYASLRAGSVNHLAAFNRQLR
ncbi:MAG: DUF2202 domain-containing protein [bacterium]